MSSAILAVLKEDKHKVSYRPRFASLTDSIEAAVLLEDVIYWWGKMGEKPYYKFREACDHKLYKRGESWCEELGFNLYEYNKALAIIATKITKGVSKKDAMAFSSVPTRLEGETDEQILVRMQDAVQHLVIYWTDASNTTWFWLNEILLEEFVNRIYLEEFEGIRSLRKLILGRTRKGRKSTSHKDSSSTTQALPEERENAPAQSEAPETANAASLSPSKTEPERDVTPLPVSEVRKVARDAFTLQNTLNPVIETYLSCFPARQQNRSIRTSEKAHDSAERIAELFTLDEVKALVIEKRKTNSGYPFAFLEGDLAQWAAEKESPASPPPPKTNGASPAPKPIGDAYRRIVPGKYKPDGSAVYEDELGAAS